jgi:hypothetical protein
MGFMRRREKWESEQRAAMRPVLMQFRHDDTAGFWRVTFRPRGDTIALPRVLHFGTEDKLRDLFQRFGATRMAEDVAALEFAIRTGRGNVELMLGEEQLRKLWTPKRPTLRTERI